MFSSFESGALTITSSDRPGLYKVKADLRKHDLPIIVVNQWMMRNSPPLLMPAHVLAADLVVDRRSGDIRGAYPVAAQLIYDRESPLVDIAVCRERVKVIENNRNRPFFLYLAHWGIHNPLQALQEDYDAYAHIDDHALRVYSGMIRALDRSVGRVTRALEENGLTDNTLIVFTSDNGGARYIGLPDVNKPYRGFKLSHFEGGTHVPFMAKWPARISPGSEYDEAVHHIDLFHTFAAAAGAEVPDDRKLDGVDLVPYVRGDKLGAPHETLFWREGYHQSVQHQGWKLIRTELPDNKRWLFHLAEDPTEQNNLAVEFPGRMEILEALLDAHNAEQADPLWPSVIQSPQLIDKHGGQPYEEGDEYIYWPN